MINPQMMQMVNQLKSNSMSVFGRMGMPQNIMNDPNAIIQNLMNRGMVSQQQYDAAVKMAQQMGMK